MKLIALINCDPATHELIAAHFLDRVVVNFTAPVERPAYATMLVHRPVLEQLDSYVQPQLPVLLAQEPPVALSPACLLRERIEELTAATEKLFATHPYDGVGVRVPLTKAERHRRNQRNRVARKARRMNRYMHHH